VICGNCGTDNEAGRKFCDNCGAGLASGCPNCGSANRPGARFCAECGTTLAASAGPTTAPAASAPVAERRVVSILFADLVGFTPFAEERDAEDVRETLSKYFELASDVIRRYGGTVEKFIGDAVMAVWGAPIAHEDDAERAVRAALDLVDAVRALGPEVQARAGVLTGEAAVTLGATNQGMVAGDLVNTASRLQSVAPPGTVLVGEATQRAASQAIAFEEAGEQTLKGKAAPVPAWRALRLVAEIGGKNRSEGLEAPFVGRDDELRLLKDLFLATGREKKIRLVSVIGPAGIGKSRLAWEFLKYVDGLVEDTYWHTGRSPAYGEGITFWALGEMVRERCGLVETDDEATTRANVAASVHEWAADEAEGAWIEAALLGLMGIESGAGSEQLFAAWRTYFERIAAKAPVVMVFEDLHFADSGTLDFIDHLLEWSKGLPIMVVTLARPELLERRTDWGAGKRSFTSLYLEPLPTDAMRDLLAGLIPGLPESAAGAIVGRADGIPLYAVETVRMLLAEGRLREEGDAYVPVGDLTKLAVPETLTALVAARLDGLDPADRALVHDAAVLGQSFTLAGLAAVSGVEAVALDERLRSLVRRELLTRESDPRSPEQGQYAFVQAVIREVAYNTLARADRKTRHLAAARFFEALGSDELAGALAGHYLAAQANAPDGPEADALASQARIALKSAAERAAGLGAHDQAISFLEQAVTVSDTVDEQGRLLERASIEAGLAARSLASTEYARRAMELYRSAGDRLGVARAASVLGHALFDEGAAQAAIDILEPAAAEFADLWPAPEVLGLSGALAGAYAWKTSRSDDALAVADRVLLVAEHEDQVAVLVLTLRAKGGALAMLGRVREGVGVIRAAEDLAREAGLVSQQLRTIHLRTFWELEWDAAGAVAGMREGMELARRIGDRRAIERFANNIGFSEFQLGNWQVGLDLLEEFYDDVQDPSQRAALLGNALVIRSMRGESLPVEFAELHRLVGELPNSFEINLMDALASQAAARGQWAEARRFWRQMAERDRGNAPVAYYQTARMALWDGNVDGAQEDLAAIDATGVHGRVVENRRETIRAGIAAAEGRTGEALSAYRDVIRTWRELGLGNDEHFTAVDMVFLIGAANPDVKAYAIAARQFFERVGARPFVERLDAAMAEAGGSAAPSTEMVATPEAPVSL
jgi:class 3 adenylate cyclase/tetratricopeptide (TPR) repeat protein